METKNKIIKITGSAEIEKDLELDQEVRLVVIGAVVKQEIGSNQDGTFDRITKIKIERVEF